MKAAERLKQKRLFLLDMDGTIYLDEKLFDGAADFLQTVRQRGAHYLFLTNNSSRGAEAYVEKMRRLGVEA
ncbi:MAG: HAD family hydrolase, partial [Oscillospiraceae bacterium]|nr:HAD family hydrolase [Oscillospiraceae bacterium]